MKKMHFLVASIVGATALTASAETKPEQTSTERIRVISTHDVFDKDIVSADGRPVGGVEYVLIQTNDGKIDYLVLESEMQGIEGKLMMIPFDAIKSELEGDPIRLQATMDKISQAPTTAENELATLIQSDRLQQVESYWRPYTRTQRTTPPEEGTPMPGQEEEGTPRSGTVQPMPREEPMPREGATPRGQTGTPQAGGEKQPQSGMGGQTTAQTGNTYILLGEHSHKILRPGVTTFAELSLDIVASNRNTLGEIKNVVIDIDDRRVAYTLVSRGGFLGLGMNYVAVPMQAIELTAQDELRLKVPAATFQNMRGYMDDDVPHSVLRSDLERVYKQFKVTPYWKAAKEEVATRR